LKNIVIIKTRFAAIAAAVLVGGVLTNQPAFAQGDPEGGKAIGYSCLGCHGIDGYRNAYPSYRVPKLGGQTASYLSIALRGYRDGTREHPTMIAQAASLTDEQIDDVAAYLASLVDTTAKQGQTPDAAPPQEAAVCAACHGQHGFSMGPLWPTLAGQHEDYLVKSLEAYRSGVRKDPVMMPMAANLSDQDIALLARYFSRLDGLETTEAE
jgi:cytochrome c553